MLNFQSPVSVKAKLDLSSALILKSVKKHTLPLVTEVN